MLDMASPSVYFTVSLPAAEEEVMMSLGEGLQVQGRRGMMATWAMGGCSGRTRGDEII